MHRYALSLLLAVGILVEAGSVSAQWGAIPQRTRHSQGLEVFGGLGGNVCLESGDTNCENIDPSMAMLLGVGYRFSSFFGLYLDANYGLLSPDGQNASGNDIYTLSLMPTVRFFAELRDAEVYGGIGYGYARVGVKDDDTDIYYDRWNNFKLLAGGAIQIWPQLYVGGEIQLQYNVDGKWDFCIDANGQSNCGESEKDVFDLLQPFVFVKYRF